MSVIIILIWITKNLLQETSQFLQLFDLIYAVQLFLALTILSEPEGLNQALMTYVQWAIKRLSEQEIIVKDIQSFQ